MSVLFLNRAWFTKIPVVGRWVHAYADHLTPPDYMAVSVQEELGMRVGTEALDHCGYHRLSLWVSQLVWGLAFSETVEKDRDFWKLFHQPADIINIPVVIDTAYHTTKLKKKS